MDLVSGNFGRNGRFREDVQAPLLGLSLVESDLPLKCLAFPNTLLIPYVTGLREALCRHRSVVVGDLPGTELADSYQPSHSSFKRLSWSWMLLKSTHPVLNQDIVYTIFGYLAIPDASWYDYDTAARTTKSAGDATERRSTLARCARVCRAFLFPAVSILWRNIGSLETLVVLAPRLASQDAEVPVSVGLSWLPTYAQYARWIRAVHNPTISLLLPLHLPCSDESSCLGSLPQLMRLRWVQEVPGTMDLLTLLSPALRSLHILFRISPNATSSERQTFVEALLLQAAKTAPNLTYLRITRTRGISEAWLRRVDQFNHLDTLDICEPTYDEVTTCDLLPGLITMDSLRSLKLRLPTPLIHTTPDPATRSFDALRDVSLDCKQASLDDAIVFLRAVSSPHLESVRLDHCECPTSSLVASLLELCTVLHNRFRSTLRSVSLSVTPIGAPVVFEHPLLKYLEPLLHIRELFEFRFAISRTSRNVSVIVPEADLVSIAESWTRLRHLDLNYDPTDEPPTVQTISSFARHCPSLTTLNLPCIDARDVAFAPLDAPHPSLISFGVFDGGWDSLIPEPGDLAKFLKTLFPKVALERPQLGAEQWSQSMEIFDRL